jgi:hypothetical protein
MTADVTQREDICRGTVASIFCFDNAGHFDGFRMEVTINEKKAVCNPLSAVTGLLAVTVPSNPLRCCRD